MSSYGAIIVTLVLSFFGWNFWRSLQNYQRQAFIENYQWPPGLLSKLENHYAGFTRKESALVGNGLRQFFLAYLKSGKRYVAMPSQCADELWHEFILHTREYEAFCKRAFGQFFHHMPATVLSREHKSNNEGLRRVWWHCCKLENIDTTSPTRLPLLFALDKKFSIPNGFVYEPDCEKLRRNGAYGGECGGDFSSPSVDGGTDGFGGDGDGGDGGGDGGGCGGGCGGD